MDDHLGHYWWDGSKWRGWEDLGGKLTGQPAVASWGENRLDVFAKGAGNDLGLGGGTAPSGAAGTSSAASSTTGPRRCPGARTASMSSSRAGQPPPATSGGTDPASVIGVVGADVRAGARAGPAGRIRTRAPRRCTTHPEGHPEERSARALVTLRTVLLAHVRGLSPVSSKAAPQPAGPQAPPGTGSSRRPAKTDRAVQRGEERPPRARRSLRSAQSASPFVHAASRAFLTSHIATTSSTRSRRCSARSTRAIQPVMYDALICASTVTRRPFTRR